MKKVAQLTCLLLGILCFSGVKAEIVKLGFSGEYLDVNANDGFQPFLFSITYDTTLNTSSTFIPVGTTVTPAPDNPSAPYTLTDSIYGYSASGIVGMDITLAGTSFSAADVKTRSYSPGYSADLFFNTDIAKATPTGASIQLDAKNFQYFYLGLVSLDLPAFTAGLTTGFNAETADQHMLAFPDTMRITRTVISAVPEPETYAMLLAGLALTGIAARRRKPLA